MPSGGGAYDDVGIDDDEGDDVGIATTSDAGDPVTADPPPPPSPSEPIEDGDPVAGADVTDPDAGDGVGDDETGDDEGGLDGPTVG